MKGIEVDFEKYLPTVASLCGLYGMVSKVFNTVYSFTAYFMDKKLDVLINKDGIKVKDCNLESELE